MSFDWMSLEISLILRFFCWVVTYNTSHSSVPCHYSLYLKRWLICKVFFFFPMLPNIGTVSLVLRVELLWSYSYLVCSSELAIHSCLSSRIGTLISVLFPWLQWGFTRFFFFFCPSPHRLRLFFPWRGFFSSTWAPGTLSLLSIIKNTFLQLFSSLLCEQPMKFMEKKKFPKKV